MEDALKNPGEVVVSMLTPPPGTSPAIKGLYYAENAHLAVSVLKGSKKVAGGLVSKVLGKQIASNTMKKVTQPMKMANLLMKKATQVMKMESQLMRI